MQLSVEISLYPLANDYIPAIKRFIETMQSTDGIDVHPNTMSTQIFGEYDVVMAALSREMKKSFEQYGTQIFVCKFLNADRRP